MFVPRPPLFALAAALLFPSSPARAQDIHLWTDTQAGPVASANYAASVAGDAQGRIFAVGTVRGPSSEDLRIVAYGPTRQILWQHSIDLGGPDHAADLVVDETANAVYVVGFHSAASIGPWEIWRLDRLSGAILWHTSYSGPLGTGGRAWGVSVDATGGLVVHGSMAQGPSVDVVWIARFDSSGVLSWEWSVPSPLETGGYVVSAQIAASGDILARTREYGGPVSPLSLHRISASGSTLWSQVVNTGDQAFAGPAFDSASNSVHAVRVPMVGGNNLVKLDPAGAVVWTRPVQDILGINNTVYFVYTDSNDEIVVLGSNNRVVRLDVNGNVLWDVSPTKHILELGTAGGLAIDTNGDAVVLTRPHAPNTFADFVTVSRIDRNGQFRWSQGIRAHELDTELVAYSFDLLPHGAAVIGGKTTAAGSTTSNMFVAAVREQSRKACVGDGSSGACPCGNQHPSNALSGCSRSPTFLSGARLEDTGIASVGDDTLRFIADSSVNGLAVMLQGPPTSTAAAFQDGLLCLGSPLLRLYTLTAATPAVDLPPSGARTVSEQSSFMGDVIPPGGARSYQMYFRSSTSFCQPGNGNFTNAVVVHWGQ